jgi:hypothetical protein
LAELLLAVADVPDELAEALVAALGRKSRE